MDNTRRPHQNSATYFSWTDENLKRLGLEDHQFIDLLRGGLKPYESDSKRPISCPEEYHEYSDEYPDAEFFESWQFIPEFEEGQYQGNKEVRTFYNWIRYYLLIDENLKRDQIKGPATKNPTGKPVVFSEENALEVKERLKAGYQTRIMVSDATEVAPSINKETEKEERGYKEEIIDLIKRVKPEIEDIYSGMMTNLNEHDPDIHENSLDIQKEAALFWFDQNEYEILKRDYFEDPDVHLFYRQAKDKGSEEDDLPGFDLSHPKRDFIGKLCQIIINDHFPRLFLDLNNPPNGYGAKPLHRMYLKLT